MSPRRRLLLAALAAGVALLHLGLAAVALPEPIGAGAATRVPTRIAVDFVRTLAPKAPTAFQRPAPAAAPAARGERHRLHSQLPPMPALIAAAGPAASAASVASAASADAEVPREDALPAVGLLAEAPEAGPASAPMAVPAVLASSGSAPASAASAAVLADATAATAAPDPHFEWPPSTRLRYHLTGNYRGPVDGQASVEWRRSGEHYQVFMDLSIGPPFAPIITRHVGSDGEIRPEGLYPRRYDEDTRVLLRAPRQLTVWLDPDQVRLADGHTVPRPPGVQDSASQFVQLTWLFTTRPELLRSGSSIVLPLALARQVEPWTYDVLASEVLYTPAGPVEAVHVKPRREARPGRDLSAEIWVAPSLQYLPVRILITQDADTYVDLNIERLPEQAAPGR